MSLPPFHYHRRSSYLQSFLHTLEIEMDYDVIMEATGAKSKEVAAQMISSQYRIKATDPKKEKEVLYKGLSLLAIGIIAFIWGIGKEKVVDKLAPHRQPWDIT